MNMRPVDIRRVKAGGEVGRRIEITARNNVLMIDMDNDVLAPFRARSLEEGYIGLGKLIDTVARLAVYTADEGLLALRRRIVSEALKTQEPDGYIGIQRPDRRVVSLWDVHEMSYLIYGLTTDFFFFREEASIEAARRVADFLIKSLGNEPGKVMTTYVMVTLGLEYAMLSLYEQTREQKYLDFCTGPCRLQEWNEPIVLGRWGKIEGHVYNYLGRCLAQLKLHSLQPDTRLLEPSRRALDFMTRGDGLTIAGLAGDHECWHDT